MPNVLSVPSPKRFDNPFDPNMDPAVVEELLSRPPFDAVEADRFPKHIRPADLFRNDSRIVKADRGEIIFRMGDYGNSAFVILKGYVRVLLSGCLTDTQLGRRPKQELSFLETIKRFFNRSPYPEVRDPDRLRQDPMEMPETGDLQASYQDLDSLGEVCRTITLHEGDLFGEISALARTPRTATVIAEGPVEMLEIRWQGLRDLRRYDTGFRRHVDELYRERSLKTHLLSCEIFTKLAEDEAQLDALAEATEFESYGDFEWTPDYRNIGPKTAENRFDHEPLIAEEGHYVNGLLLIRAGFVRLSVKVNKGHRTIAYLGSGDVFGLAEIYHNWRFKDPVPYQYSLRAVGYVDVLRVPTKTVEKLLLPKLPPQNLPLIIHENRPDGGLLPLQGNAQLEEGMLDFIVDERFNNGSATMIIDTNRCTGCDDCVRACAATHDGNPRFIRHGKRYGSYMIANACMHCVDPVCMIGCPTGAIHRTKAGGQVVINDITCIGCSACANNCPYDNIRMVEVRDPRGNFIYAEESGLPITKATKCDLCIDLPGGPACKRACPHDALTRMDMHDIPSLAEWASR